MKKHGVINDTLNFPSDDEEDGFLGGSTQWDKPTPGDKHVLGGRSSTEDDSHDEWT